MSKPRVSRGKLVARTLNAYGDGRGVGRGFGDPNYTGNGLLHRVQGHGASHGFGIFHRGTGDGSSALSNYYTDSADCFKEVKNG